MTALLLFFALVDTAIQTLLPFFRDLWIGSGPIFEVEAKFGEHSDNGDLAARVYNHVRVGNEDETAKRVTFDAGSVAKLLANAA